MLDWYLLLPFSEQIFAGIALGFGSILFLLLLLSIFGGDIEPDTDFGADDGALTLKGILAFLTFFGFGAWALTRAGSPQWLAVLVGLGAGYAMMSTVALLLARLRRLDSDGGRRQEQLIGQEADVYLRIPPSGQGSGRIQVRQGTRLVEIEAFTKGPSIASGEQARVIEILEEGSVLVEAITRVGERLRTHGYVE